MEPTFPSKEIRREGTVETAREAAAVNNSVLAIIPGGRSDVRNSVSSSSDEDISLLSIVQINKNGTNYYPRSEKKTTITELCRYEDTDIPENGPGRTYDHDHEWSSSFSKTGRPEEITPLSSYLWVPFVHHKTGRPTG